MLLPGAGVAIPLVINVPVNNLVPCNVGTVTSTVLPGKMLARSATVFMIPSIFITDGVTPAGNIRLTVRGSITGVNTPVFTATPLATGGAVTVSPVLLGTTVYTALGSRSSNTTCPPIGET